MNHFLRRAQGHQIQMNKICTSSFSGTTIPSRSWCPSTLPFCLPLKQQKEQSEQVNMNCTIRNMTLITDIAQNLVK